MYIWINRDDGDIKVTQITIGNNCSIYKVVSGKHCNAAITETGNNKYIQLHMLL